MSMTLCLHYISTLKRERGMGFNTCMTSFNDDPLDLKQNWLNCLRLFNKFWETRIMAICLDSLIIYSKISVEWKLTCHFICRGLLLPSSFQSIFCYVGHNSNNFLMFFSPWLGREYLFPPPLSLRLTWY